MDQRYDLGFEEWDKTKIEQVHAQFIKIILGCNFKTSNIMSRGEVGERPLLNDIIKRTISYMQHIQTRKNSLVFKAWKFEANNEVSPNFNTFINKFDLNFNDMINKNKLEVKKTCHDYYDRFWRSKLQNSPKAISYQLFKNNVILESYLHQIEIKNTKYKIALTRFRLSNHNLLIEKGRHMRPRLDRNERKCFLCKDTVEDEQHFITKCPLYSKQRSTLYHSLQNNSIHFNSLTDEQKFVFIMTNEDVNVTINIGKFIFDAFLVREKLTFYFFN